MNICVLLAISCGSTLPPAFSLASSASRSGSFQVLVDPAQSHVVRPAARQRRVVQGVDHGPQRGGRHGHQIRDAPRPVQAGQLDRQVLEQQPQQERVALGVVAAHQGRSKLPEVAIARALPAARRHRRRAQRQADGAGVLVHAGRLHQPQQHQPVQQGRGGLLHGLEAKAPDQAVLPQAGQHLRPLVPQPLVGPVRVAAVRDKRLGLGPHLLVNPALQPAPPLARGLGQARVAGPDRQAIHSLGLRVQIGQQALAQLANGRGQLALGIGGHRHGELDPRSRPKPYHRASGGSVVKPRACRGADGRPGAAACACRPAVTRDGGFAVLGSRRNRDRSFLTSERDTSFIRGFRNWSSQDSAPGGNPSSWHSSRLRASWLGENAIVLGSKNPRASLIRRAGKRLVQDLRRHRTSPIRGRCQRKLEAGDPRRLPLSQQLHLDGAVTAR